jgi:hypothetical protein
MEAAVATASSSWGTAETVPKAAINGHDETAWVSGKNATTAELTVTFPHFVTINKVRIIWKFKAMDFVVSVLKDGGKWRIIKKTEKNEDDVIDI